MMPGISLWSHWRWSSLAAPSQEGRWDSLMEPLLEKNQDRDTLIKKGNWVGSWNMFESGRKWSFIAMVDTKLIKIGEILVEQMMLIKIWVFPKIGVPQIGWFIMEKPIKWMIWGYHYFRKPPSGSALNLTNSVTVPDMATFSTRIEETSPSSLPKRSFSAKLLGL